VKILSLAVVAVLGYSCAGWALDYSADVVSAGKGQSVTGKIYVSQDKIRMDAAGTTSITRMDKKVAWIVMPGQKMYMEQPINPVSVAGASEKMPGELDRKLVGPDTVDGKAVDKYRIRYASNGVEAVVLQWIDPKTNIPLKTAAEDGSWSMEYKNLAIEAQPGDLFEVPHGYQKFEMPDVKDVMRGMEQKNN